MWKNSQRYLEHCLYFDFSVCILFWLNKNRGKDFRFAYRKYLHLDCAVSVIGRLAVDSAHK
jgi:hypothetical protein